MSQPREDVAPSRDSRRIQVLLAAVIWTAVGVMLPSLGIFWMESAFGWGMALLLAVPFVAIGFAKGHFLLDGVARRAIGADRGPWPVRSGMGLLRPAHVAARRCDDGDGHGASSPLHSDELAVLHPRLPLRGRGRSPRPREPPHVAGPRGIGRGRRRLARRRVCTPRRVRGRPVTCRAVARCGTIGASKHVRHEGALPWPS